MKIGSLSIPRKSNTRISGFVSRISERLTCACHDQRYPSAGIGVGSRVLLLVTLRVLSRHVTSDI